MDILDIVTRVAMFFVPFLFALTFHEYAHGFVAKKLGDDTADHMGRLTMNPIPHLDIVGTVILPIALILTQAPFFFGWAKPVPVDPRNLKNYRTDMFWIAAAGPLSNLLLAFIGAFSLVYIIGFHPQWQYTQALNQILVTFILFNAALAIFNMIPVPPLDGSKVLARFLSPDINRKIEENQHMLSFALLFLFVSGAIKILSIPIFFVMNIFVGFWQYVLL